MGDSSIHKVQSKHSPIGPEGQKYLAAGISISMRLWENEQPTSQKAARERPYETIGYVISGRAELHSAGQVMTLEPGDSWVVPRSASHTYKILESFTAIEVTHPPAALHGRDVS
jgi:quercetin dioxygenase-like cupin family protein